jgi:hypothetical protein
MDARKPDAPDAPKKPYEAPAIRFEHATEALAGVCDGTANCPSKQANGVCDSFEPCQSNNS